MWTRTWSASSQQLDPSPKGKRRSLRRTPRGEFRTTGASFGR